MNLQRLCTFLGAFMAAMGIGQLIVGARAVPGAGPTDGATDSQIRALGALAIWGGMTQVWATKRGAIGPLKLLAAVTASLVGARALSMYAQRGQPFGLQPVFAAREAASAAALLGYSIRLAREQQSTHH
jgi:hypothetical protein